MKWRALLVGSVLGLSVSIPASAKFLQADPLRYADGMNLYAYANNDPLNLVDPMGTCSVDYSGVIQDCTVNFDPSMSTADQDAYLQSMADWGLTLQAAGTMEMQNAWAEVDTINIGPGHAVDPSGQVAEGTASFGFVSQDGTYVPDGGELAFSSDQFVGANGALDTTAFATTFFHELGHGTPDNAAAFVQGDFTRQENIAEYKGMYNATMFNILPGNMMVRQYSTPSIFQYTTMPHLGAVLGYK